MAKITRCPDKAFALLLRSHHFAPRLSHNRPTLVSRLHQARLFVCADMSSWVSLKIYISNVRPIYVCIELRS